MVESLINSTEPIVHVPLNEKDDYDDVSFSSELDWTDDDRKRVEEVINGFYNAFQSKDEKNLEVSFGELLLKYDIHPKADRRKLIRGFLVRKFNSPPKPPSTPPAMKEMEQDIFSVIRSLAPDFIKDDEDASEDLDKLIERARDFGIPSSELKLEVFISILNSLEAVASRYVSDQSYKERLSYLIKMVKTYFPQSYDGG